MALKRDAEKAELEEPPCKRRSSEKELTQACVDFQKLLQEFDPLTQDDRLMSELLKRRLEQLSPHLSQALQGDKSLVQHWINSPHREAFMSLQKIHDLIQQRLRICRDTSLLSSLEFDLSSLDLGGTF